MAFIYDLDNEYGGYIIADDDSKQSALQVNNDSAHPAIAVYSTASGRPLHIRTVQTPPLFQAGVTNSAAIEIGSAVIGNQTTTPLVFANLSLASCPVMDFGNNYVSVASIKFDSDKLGCAQKWVIVRAGAVNYGMPLFSLSTAINGPGAY
jgi:hypothetical protein